jgi:serine/threonine protein kinase
MRTLYSYAPQKKTLKCFTPYGIFITENDCLALANRLNETNDEQEEEVKFGNHEECRYGDYISFHFVMIIILLCIIYIVIDKWMTPEIKQGEEITPSSDIYSLGLVMWQLVIKNISLNELGMKIYIYIYKYT